MLVAAVLTAMLRPFLHGLVELLAQPSCRVCHQPLVQVPLQQEICAPCWSSIGLPRQPLQGKSPLPWIAAGSYEGRMRSMLLILRRTRDLATVRALSYQLRELLPDNAILVPVPSWKQGNRANPLPTLLANALQRPMMRLLTRTSTCFPQHSLDRQQRWQNSQGTMDCSGCEKTPVNWSRHQAWIVDDILTTGATVWTASDALRSARIPIAGAVCLGRTPKRRSQQGSRPSTR